MNRGEDSDSIPNDLVLEILSRLPAKSTGRFLCVSKLWGSMLHKAYFTDLFLTRSSARPRLLFVIQPANNDFLVFSSPQPQYPYEKSSIVVAADFHTKFGRDKSYGSCLYASGLLYFTSLQMSSKDKETKRLICNPITGQFAILPKLKIKYPSCHEMLGFDLIGKQFKVLSMNNKLDDEKVHYILTLGTEKVRWRKIQCPFIHEVRSSVGISISGVLYYVAQDIVDLRYFIGCFDVRSEKFTSLNLSTYWYPSTLINYKGKLGVTNLRYAYDGGFPLKLRLRVLEDLEKQEWSKYVYTLMPDDDKAAKAKGNYISVAGMTCTGEIVLVTRSAYKPYYFFYFNPERNTLLSVEIQGVGEDHKWFEFHTVHGFVDHVEDLQFNIMKEPSINPPEKKRKTTSTSTSSKKYRHASTSTSSRKDHQGRTVAQPQ